MRFTDAVTHMIFIAVPLYFWWGTTASIREQHF
jgi:hypothetical protein